MRNITRQIIQLMKNFTNFSESLCDITTLLEALMADFLTLTYGVNRVSGGDAGGTTYYE